MLNVLQKPNTVFIRFCTNMLVKCFFLQFFQDEFKQKIPINEIQMKKVYELLLHIELF